jgi:TorA maturation chaperone TorD
MSWLSNLFGKKIKAPRVEPFEEFDYDTTWATEQEKKKLSRKRGFLSALMTGNKTPYLGTK